jgi:hypothetical protein
VPGPSGHGSGTRDVKQPAPAQRRRPDGRVIPLLGEVDHRRAAGPRSEPNRSEPIPFLALDLGS